jgi:diguanylate cyclase (GGDEF)-like protein
LGLAGLSGRPRTAKSRFGRLWLALARPFQRSIHIRFRWAFGLAVFGFGVITAITFFSGRVLLSTYQDSVAEARLELVPVHRLENALREIDHSAYRYAIEGDRSALAGFKPLQEEIDRYFNQLGESESRFGSVKHAHSRISIAETLAAWKKAQARLVQVLQQPAGTAKAVAALNRAHPAIDPVYDTIAQFHHLSLQDMQLRLQYAHTIMNRTYLAVLGAILIGLVVLIAVGIVVGRSVLQPISKLQEAASRLAEKDFSHRVRLRNNVDELGQLGRAFNVASSILQRLYHELERRSKHDGLTGALNRAAFDERLPVECDRADRHERPLSLLMVDIDFFKRVNDGYGHQAGDCVLKAIVGMLNEISRPGDVVARYGGEEFVVILPETDANDAKAMAERVRSTIGRARIDFAAGEDIAVTVSVGCASREPNTATPGDLVRAADAALYQAKRSGRNRVVTAGELEFATAHGPDCKATAA